MKKIILLFCLFSTPVFAETTPAILTVVDPVPGFVTGNYAGLTAAAACTDMAANAGVTFYGVLNNQCWVTYNGGNPYAYSNYGPTWVCEANPTIPNVSSCPSEYQCPPSQNWTLVGSMCTRPDCTADQTRDPASGVCTQGCNSTGDAVSGFTGYFPVSSFSSLPPPACYGSCLVVFQEANPPDQQSRTIDTVLQNYISGSYHWESSSCSITPTLLQPTLPIQTLPPNSCVVESVGPAGYFRIDSISSYTPQEGCYQGCRYAFYDDTPGTAHESIEDGVAVYYDLGKYYGMGVACSEADSLPPSVPSLPTATCPPGYMTVQFSWGVECTNSLGTTPDGTAPTPDDSPANTESAPTNGPTSSGSTTSGTSTTTTNADGSTTTTTSSTTVTPPIDFSPLTTLLDSISSTIDLIADFLTEPVQPVPTTLDNETELENEDISVPSIVPYYVGGAGVCPADATLVIAGHIYKTSYQTYCNFAQGVRPILLMFAWLAAAGILIGGFKQR